MQSSCEAQSCVDFQTCVDTPLELAAGSAFDLDNWCWQEKQGRSASQLSRPPLADVTPRQFRITPVALSSSSNPLMRSSNSDVASALAFATPPAGGGHDNVEESESACLSAGRWLRGLAEECVDNVLTPIKPQSTDTDESKAQVMSKQRGLQQHKHTGSACTGVDELLLDVHFPNPAS